MSDVRYQKSIISREGAKERRPLPFKGRVGVGMGLSGISGHVSEMRLCAFACELFFAFFAVNRVFDSLLATLAFTPLPRPLSRKGRGEIRSFAASREKTFLDCFASLAMTPPARHAFLCVLCGEMVFLIPDP